MTDRAAEQRHTVHFAGRVQGVGFRYTVEQIAGQFPVTGYVQNLPDGRVLLVMEGAKSDLDALIDRSQYLDPDDCTDTDICHIIAAPQ